MADWSAKPLAALATGVRMSCVGAVRMVGEIRGEHESDWAAMARVAELLGIGTPETVRE